MIFSCIEFISATGISVNDIVSNGRKETWENIQTFFVTKLDWVSNLIQMNWMIYSL